jgi:hypothetical protein
MGDSSTKGRLDRSPRPIPDPCHLTFDVGPGRLEIAKDPLGHADQTFSPWVQEGANRLLTLGPDDHGHRQVLGAEFLVAEGENLVEVVAPDVLQLGQVQDDPLTFPTKSGRELGII